MKINLVLLFFLVLFYSVVDSSCPNCLKENDICGTNKGKCSYDTTCLYNSSLTSNQTGKCNKYLRQGDECKVGEKLCIAGTLCLLDKENVYRCLDYGFATLGEDCKLDSDCSTNKLACINDVCTLKPSENCDGWNKINANCKYNEFCLCSTNSNCSCENIKLEGESCTSPDDCLGRLDCNNSVCTKKQPLGLGADCSATYNFCDYNKGLYCSKDICIEYVEPSLRSCNPNATFNECLDFERCSCSDNECYQSISPLKTMKLIYSDELEICAYDNKCSLVDNKLSSQSCLSKNCRKIMCENINDYNIKESDDCGKFAFERNLFCNSSFKITQSITGYLFIILFFVFVITF
ncbi:paramecium surface antigen repeat-containing protein [Dictyostelium discoideum AX4]|uniref:Paramecium surface antigen repeat-containing protein n=1 Tax=Dictyostelium discoideum TaxID=44689 RepID=Q54KB6_DICDI|nr:paramecium surface antigen repeat-containing protein [Dictyostelium discoideum AX4]EAL63701.2 paramecium surface antigen repeat-containing protein [Dictyostelium discoideum AX4]|eukprot:XP_637205.2 paramecium surface antigen repeat-containing protein [Dictyostelium discoideum AX4]